MKPIEQKKTRSSIQKILVPLRDGYFEVPEVGESTGRSIFVPVDRLDYEIELCSQQNGDIYIQWVPISFLCARFKKSVVEFEEEKYFEINLEGMGRGIRLRVRSSNAGGAMDNYQVTLIWELRGL